MKFLLLFLVSITSILAHDIGVTKVNITETEKQKFVLKVQASAGLKHIYKKPQLPKQCSYMINKENIFSSQKIMWEFSCQDNGLTINDKIKLNWMREGIMVSMKWFDNTESTKLFTRDNDTIIIEFSQLLAGSGSFFDAAKRYTILGIEHILIGADHLLFVLALLLIVQGGWLLIKTITAFTVAHSITLGLATLGLINIPIKPVEAVIALSIVFLCVEIVRHDKYKPSLTYRYPWVVAFVFGLLHGLGFASVLSDIGLVQSEITTSLLFFNIGVELGQIIFVVAVLIVLRIISYLRFNTFQRLRGIPVYLIGSMSAYWVIDRTMLILSN